MNGATSGMGAAPILEVEGLSVGIRDGGRDGMAVHEVSFSLAPGETLAIVGESGCGKSLTAFALLGLLPSHARAGGRVRLDGNDILGLRGDALRRLRGARIAMIFQEPMTALNPVMRIGAQIVETIRAHEAVSRAQGRERALALLAQMRIPDPIRAFAAYPHQLSGGMRQRVMIAMALACSPGLLVADEPTTALDATVQAEILDLIDDLRRESGLAVLLISHDLGLIGRHADRVMVMYAGRAVEMRSVDGLLAGPLHPYSRGLLAARPSLGAGSRRRLTEIPGQVPGLRAMPPGCGFAPRCPHATEPCRETRPPLDAADCEGTDGQGTDGQGPEAGRVACHHWRDLRAAEPIASRPAA